MKICLTLIFLAATLSPGIAQNAPSESSGASSDASGGAGANGAAAGSFPEGAGPAGESGAPSSDQNEGAAPDGAPPLPVNEPAQQAEPSGASPPEGENSNPLTRTPADSPPALPQNAQAPPAPKPPAGGPVLPLEQITTRVRQSTQGEIIDAQLITRDTGIQVYQLKILETDGQVKVLYYDAVSGEPAGEQ